jgi:hypothetical protein
MMSGVPLETNFEIKIFITKLHLVGISAEYCLII